MVNRDASVDYSIDCHSWSDLPLFHVIILRVSRFPALYAIRLVVILVLVTSPYHKFGCAGGFCVIYWVFWVEMIPMNRYCYMGAMPKSARKRSNATKQSTVCVPN